MKILTRTGREVEPFNLKPEDICIEDISWALAHTPRFGGHTTTYYSVAQHCLLVADLVSRAHDGMRRVSMLHDAWEAYFPDVPGPLKPHLRIDLYHEHGDDGLPRYATIQMIEEMNLRRIYNSFNLKFPGKLVWAIINNANETAREVEAAHLMKNWEPERTWENWHPQDYPLFPMSAEVAANEYLHRFKNLTT